MRQPHFSVVAIAFALSTVIVTRTSAQEARLVGRLPDATRTQVDGILNTARSAGLPTEPLVDRALEGAAKRAAGDIIVRAVNRLLDELRTARLAFGEQAHPAELAAGASALRAGATRADLVRLKQLRPNQPLTVPAGVLADLVAAGVATETGIAAVLALASKAGDADYIAFRRNVERDIAQGASPAASVGVRLRAVSEMAADAPPAPTAVAGGTRGNTTTTPPRKIKP
jgi:hypothetical protein